jgi:hypothetical protein
MNQYISNGGKDNKDLWIIEDKDFALAQALYHKITQRTESTSKVYDEEYIIKDNDISQLYKKLNQLTKEWKIIGTSCEIDVSFDDDTSQKFSSFDRFSLFDKSYPAAVIEIAIKYTFLLEANIVFDEDGKKITPLQNYSITIKILNRNVLCQKKEVPSFFARRMFRPCIIIEIDYVDYMIARNIISCVDSWVNTLDTQNKPSKLLDFVQRYSMNFDDIFLFLFPIITGIVLIRKIQIDSLKGILPSMTSIVLFLFASGMTGRFFGSKLGSYISDIGESSEIILTKGDEKILKKVSHDNIKTIVKSVFTLTGSVIFNIVINIASTLIINNF